MSNAIQPHSVVSIARYGDAESYDCRRTPTLEADGQLHLTPEDGRVFAAVNARSIGQLIYTLPANGDLATFKMSMARPETHLRLFNLTLTFTEARVIWEMSSGAEPGTKMVGHLRYPWIQMVSYRPKQSFLSDPVLVLEFGQPFPVASQGWWDHTVTLGFDKAFHPGPLAHSLAQHIARHHLKYGAPDAAHGALERLAVSAPLPDPAKKLQTPYFMPAWAMFPGGVDYIGDGTTGEEWTVAT